MIYLSSQLKRKWRRSSLIYVTGVGGKVRGSNLGPDMNQLINLNIDQVQTQTHEQLRVRVSNILVN